MQARWGAVLASCALLPHSASSSPPMTPAAARWPSARPPGQPQAPPPPSAAASQAAATAAGLRACAAGCATCSAWAWCVGVRGDAWGKRPSALACCLHQHAHRLLSQVSQPPGSPSGLIQVWACARLKQQHRTLCSSRTAAAGARVLHCARPENILCLALRLHHAAPQVSPARIRTPEQPSTAVLLAAANSGGAQEQQQQQQRGEPLAQPGPARIEIPELSASAGEAIAEGLPLHLPPGQTPPPLPLGASMYVDSIQFLLQHTR